MNMTDVLEPIRSLKHRLFGAPGSVPLRYFAKFLPDDPVILEAGAYNGGDTREIARRWPQGHVHAFEPVPELLEQVRRQAAGFKNVTCYDFALGPEDGSAEFYVSGGASDASSSLLRPSGHLDEHPDVSFDRTLHVTVRSIDSWLLKTIFRKSISCGLTCRAPRWRP
jgi:FkbM family methyltransferase